MLFLRHAFHVKCDFGEEEEDDDDEDQGDGDGDGGGGGGQQLPWESKVQTRCRQVDTWSAPARGLPRLNT